MNVLTAGQMHPWWDGHSNSSGSMLNFHRDLGAILWGLGASQYILNGINLEIHHNHVQNSTRTMDVGSDRPLDNGQKVIIKAHPKHNSIEVKLP